MKVSKPFVSVREWRGCGMSPAGGVTLAAVWALLLLQNPSLSQAQPPGSLVDLHASFKFSGSFAPTPIDSNKDGLSASLITAEVNGRLEATGAGRIFSAKLTNYTNTVEYGLLNPADACTSCFRVNEDDFSVQENAYIGPIAHLIRPIRDPVVNPSLSSYRSEEWTAFYRLATGELLYTQVTGTQICIETAEPVPLCHVKQSEKIVGGTGRFKHATGDVEFTAIAPTYTSDAPWIGQDGCLDLTKPAPTFSFGPIHGSGRMTVQVPAADLT